MKPEYLRLMVFLGARNDALENLREALQLNFTARSSLVSVRILLDFLIK